MWLLQRQNIQSGLCLSIHTRPYHQRVLVLSTCIRAMIDVLARHLCQEVYIQTIFEIIAILSVSLSLSVSVWECEGVCV